MGIIILEILILLILWLTSCAFCWFVGFFVACKVVCKSVNKSVSLLDTEPVPAEEQLNRDMEAIEYLNMMTYDGTPQMPIDAEKR